jgi:type IV secretion system protein VirB2
MKLSLNTVKKNAGLVIAATAISLVFVNPAFAWGAKVTPFIAQIVSGLKEVSVPLITVALIFVGYQIAFSSKTLSALVPVVIGSLLIGAAPLLASGLIG